jgi:hypothetical protein
LSLSRLGSRTALPFAILVVLALPAAAQAAVTTSQVTSPGDPYFVLHDLDATTPATVPVSGTTDGTSGDLVDIACTWYGGSSNTLLFDVPVNANGSFEATVDLGNFPSNTCRLRALPAGAWPNNLNRFRGPRAGVSTAGTDKVAGGPNDGVVFDYRVITEGLAGSYEIQSAGSDGISESRPFSTATLEDFERVYAGAGAFYGRDEQGAGPRSQLRIDNRNAYASYAAFSLYPGSGETPGLAGITLTRSLDSTTGDVTLTESSVLVRCGDDTVTPDATTCPEFISTGVRLERSWLITRGGRMARMTDVLRSIDGAEHAVDLLLDVDRDSDEPGWMVPPSTEFERHDNGAVVSGSVFGTAPFTLLGKETDDEPDDSPEGGISATAFESSVTELRWVGESRLEAQYQRTVPADGAATLRFAFAQGINIANTRALAREAEDEWSGPSVSIDSPAAGAAIAATSAVVTGKAADNVGVASVTVNGVSAVVADDGAYSAVIPLAAGANTITVVAKDAFGNSAQATRAVTSNPPVAETAGRVDAAGFTARLARKRDRKAPFRFTVTGNLALPAGMAASVCREGSVVVQTKAGRRTISTRLAQLDANCNYRMSVSFKDRDRFFGRNRVRVLVRFLGNSRLNRTAAKQLSFRVR